MSANNRRSFLRLFPLPDGEIDNADMQQMVMYRTPAAFLISGKSISVNISGNGNIVTSLALDKVIGTTTLSGNGTVNVSPAFDKYLNTLLSANGDVNVVPAKGADRAVGITGNGTTTLSILKGVDIATYVSGSGSISTNENFAKALTANISANTSGFLLDVSKGSALQVGVSASGDLITSISVDKQIGSITLSGGGNTTVVYLRDFSETNFIYLDLSAIAESNTIELSSTSEENIKELISHARTLPR